MRGRHVLALRMGARGGQEGDEAQQGDEAQKCKGAAHARHAAMRVCHAVVHVSEPEAGAADASAPVVRVRSPVSIAATTSRCSAETMS